MSPRAACRLEMLGFERVYDYVPGKADWLARGEPIEGKRAARPTAGRFARDDAAVVELHESVGSARPRMERSPYGFALVVSGSGVLLGRIRRGALGGDDDATVEAVMEPGPSTVRADVAARELAERLRQRGLETAIVTTPEGRLLGVVRRRDLEDSRAPS